MAKQQASDELQGRADFSPAEAHGLERALTRLRAQTSTTADDIATTKKALALAQASIKALDKKLFHDADIVTIDRTAYHSSRRLANRQAGPGYTQLRHHSKHIKHRQGGRAGLGLLQHREGHAESSGSLG